MTECYIQDAAGPCHCDDCDWKGDAGDLVMINDIQERLSAGGVVPAGQCPREDCGALAYLDAVPDWARSKVVVEVTGGIAEVTTCPEAVDVEIIDHDNQEVEREEGTMPPETIDVLKAVAGKGGAT